MLHELLIAAEGVEVRFGLAEVVELKFLLQLVAHDDRNDGQGDLEDVVEDGYENRSDAND